MKKYIVILASGTGSRFGADCPKQFVKVRGKMILEHTLAACDCGVFDEMILVVSAEYVDEITELVAGKYGLPIRVVAGGSSRRESCKKGVDAIADTDGYVVIHNAAQALVRRDAFVACLAILGSCDAAVSSIPCTYTMMRVNDRSEVVEVPRRSEFQVDMGVEGFRLPVLRKAVEILDGVSANLVGVVCNHRLGNVKVFSGDPKNIKITYLHDIQMLERELDDRGRV